MIAQVAPGRARQPVDPTAAERSMAQVVEQMERAAARGVNQRVVELARAHNLRTLLIYGVAFVVAVLAATGGGFAWGQEAANAAVRETEQQLALAFRDGPGAAASWANLMKWNNVGNSMAACTGYAVKPQGPEGRRACYMPLWIDAPNLAVPARVR